MLRVLAFILIICSLSGCVAVLLGGGAAGGYYVGKDERTFGEITDDTTIATKIKAKYINEDQISAFDVSVSSYQGHVKLRGTVDTEAAKQKAIALAKETKHVKSVTTTLTVAPSS